MADKEIDTGTLANVDAALPAQAPTQAEKRKSASRDPRVFVLLRELSEVHLLLDHVSAKPTTTVAELSDEESLKKQGLDSTWIDKVCKISWPPDGSAEDKAEDAALLIRAKDYLNRLSHPASGATIAFTHLVTHEGPHKRRSRWRLRNKAEIDADLQQAERTTRGDKDQSSAATRRTLAATAYPDLVSKADAFRKAMWWISISLVVVLVVTCALSWYVAYGNAALAELATARQAVVEAQTKVDEAETAQAAPRVLTGNPAAVVGPAGAPAQGAVVPTGAAVPPRPFVRYCLGEPNAQQVQICGALRQARESLARTKESLVRWMCFGMFSNCDKWVEDQRRIDEAPLRAAALANIMGSAVLPFLYGLLGAGAAIIRSLSRKIRESLLSPRDLHLSFQQLALGAVVGASIGLFVAAPGGDGEGLLGPVALSASAISFIAGFGVEAVFLALESLIARIFNTTQTPASS